MARTCRYLDRARAFHKNIAETFHPNSYAHYGVDQARKSFSEVVWEISDNCNDLNDWQNWPIIGDTKQGTLELVRPKFDADAQSLLPNIDEQPGAVYATILPPSAPGDQTVPSKSADYQLKSGVFKGVFRQTGYEHQSSYLDDKAVACTLYSILRIAQSANSECL